jgi:hypothetical protein
MDIDWVLMATRSTAEELPLDTDLVRLIAEIASEAEGIGLIQSPPSGRLPDLAALDAVLTGLDEAGVGRRWLIEFKTATSVDRGQMARFLSSVKQALEESPLPQYEWKALLEVFDGDDLATLLGISSTSVARYSKGDRKTPDLVADRLHLLARVTGDLRGAYNDIGIRRWFQRPRSALEGRTPAQILRGDWQSDDPGPTAVRELARSLLFSPAT